MRALPRNQLADAVTAPDVTPNYWLHNHIEFAQDNDLVLILVS